MKRDYIVSIGTLILAAIIYFLFHGLLKTDDSSSLQMAFIGCMFIGMIIFLLVKTNEMDISSTTREYEASIQYTCYELSKIQTAFDKSARNNDQIFYNSLNKLMEAEKRANRNKMIYQDYIMYQAYLSALGSLRNKDKKGAEKKIEEAQECIANIEKHPDYFRSEYLNKHIFRKEDYKNLLPSYKDQMPFRIYHKDCGKVVTCPHCEIPVLKGDFEYID